MGLTCEGEGLWMAVQGFGNFKSFLCKNALCPPGQRLGGGGREGGSPARPAKRWFVTMPLGEHICPCTCRWGKCKFRQLPSAEGTGVGLCRNYPQASWNAPTINTGGTQGHRTHGRAREQVQVEVWAAFLSGFPFLSHLPSGDLSGFLILHPPLKSECKGAFSKQTTLSCGPKAASLCDTCTQFQ